MKNHHHLNDLFLIDAEKAKLMDYLERYYTESKITEQVFTKVLLNFINKQ